MTTYQPHHLISDANNHGLALDSISITTVVLAHPRIDARVRIISRKGSLAKSTDILVQPLLDGRPAYLPFRYTNLRRAATGAIRLLGVPTPKITGAAESPRLPEPTGAR